MNKKTKIIIGILAVLISAAAFYMYQISKAHSGKMYYTRIINEGTATGVQLADNVIEYEYHEPAFDSDGNKLDIDFNSFIERALKPGAYLSIVYNDKNGVIRYTEINREEVPEKALEGLDQYAD